MTAKRGERIRNGQQTPQELAAQREREHKAVQLALAGASYESIAQECGYANKGGAWKAVHRLLARVDEEDAERLREVEGARLDRLQAAHWPAALRGDVKAAAICLRILERRARLFGLDAPLVADVTIRDEVDEQIRALAAELAAAAHPVKSD